MIQAAALHKAMYVLSLLVFEMQKLSMVIPDIWSPIGSNSHSTGCCYKNASVANFVYYKIAECCVKISLIRGFCTVQLEVEFSFEFENTADT